jgi:hypothetical protein
MNQEFPDRGGRRIRITMTVLGDNGIEYPLIDTGTREAKFRRPAQALYDFVWKTYEFDIANDSMYILPSFQYLVQKQNDVLNIKKMWGDIINGINKK